MAEEKSWFSRAVRLGARAVDEAVDAAKPVGAWTQDAAERVLNAAPARSDVEDWARRQGETLATAMPTWRSTADWVAANTPRVSVASGPTAADLPQLESTLNGIVAAIRQVSDRRARHLTSVVIGKLGAAAATGGIAGLITTFGAASTGTAIASLSGAAATTAKLYWIGSIIGMGTAAGGVMLAATGLGAGVAAAYFGKQFLFGSARDEDDLGDHEKAILLSCLTLTRAVQEQIASGIDARPAEMRALAEHAILPLIRQIEMHWSPETLEQAEIKGCRPFTEVLAPINLRKLDSCRQELGRIALAALMRT